MSKNSITFVKPMDVKKDKQRGNAGKKSIILSSEQSLTIVQYIKLENIE